MRGLVLRHTLTSIPHSCLITQLKHPHTHIILQRQTEESPLLSSENQHKCLCVISGIKRSLGWRNPFKIHQMNKSSSWPSWKQIASNWTQWRKNNEGQIWLGDFIFICYDNLSSPMTLRRRYKLCFYMFQHTHTHREWEQMGGSDAFRVTASSLIKQQHQL